MERLENKLERFTVEKKISGKGALALVLVVTRRARDINPPYSHDNFLAKGGGQVAGLGKGAVQSILRDHQITHVLAEEGGRTSRGSIDRMRAYLDLLNQLAEEGEIDFIAIENWWIGQVEKFFIAKPLKLKLDTSKSLGGLISDLMESAFARQRARPGTMVAGAVLQHLVGAKLEIALPEKTIEHNGFSVADAPSDRKGDFLVGDAAIHVTTAPSEALIRKCQANLAQNMKPIIVTTENGVGGAVALTKNAGVADRIDILEICRFVTTNVLEWSSFESAKRPMRIRQLVDVYNRIVGECETDPSLKIEIG